MDPEHRLRPPPPVLDRSDALFLDFDGTLADLAQRPDAVETAPGLVETLGRLARMLDGALAVVSGRPVEDLDRFLAPLKLPLAAEHGAVLRLADGRVRRADPPDLNEALQIARDLAKSRHGLIIERKSASVALHYRQAPEHERACVDALDRIAKDNRELELLRGKCVIEIRRAGIDKGGAIATLMSSPPFAGRRPVFAGDDVTDEAGFTCVQSIGGLGIKVGPGQTVAMHACESPHEFRIWLATAADAAAPPAKPGAESVLGAGSA